MPYVPPPDPEETTAIRRATKKLRLPLVSGRASALMLLMCFCLVAGIMFIVTMAVHIPAWISFELMLVAWWVIWILALSHFLYHGKRVSDDHEMPSPRNWLGRAFAPKMPTGTRAAGSGWTDLGYAGADAEGCIWALGILLSIGVILLLAWLLIELVIPVMTLVAYALVRGMLAKVANERHVCKGRFAASFFWGTVWATVYTAPLALLVWVVHLIAVQRAG